MLGLSNTLSLWNLKQKGQQEASNAAAARSPEGSNAGKGSCPPSLSNFIHLAKLTQMAQLAQIKEQQRVAEVQVRVQAAHAQAQAHQAQSRMALLGQLRGSLALQHQAQFVNGAVTLPQSQSDMMSSEQVQAHQFPPQQSQAHVQALQLQHQLIRNRLTSMHSIVSSQQEQQQERIF